MKLWFTFSILLYASFSLAETKPSAEVTAPANKLVCDDLYSAACLNSNGTLKSKTKRLTEEHEMQGVVNKAREQALQSIGFKNFDEALKATFQEAGLEVSEQPDPVAWSYWKSEGPGLPAYGENAQKVFKLGALCAADVAEISKLQPDESSDWQKLVEKRRAATKIEDKYIQSMIKLYANDIPGFFKKNIFKNCQRLRAKPSLASVANVDAMRTCSHEDQIRREAAELFREEQKSTFKEKAEAFVRKNFVRTLIYSEPPEKDATGETPVRDIVAYELNNTLKRANYLCDDYAEAAELAAAKVTERLLQTVNKSKVTIEALLDKFYNPKTRPMVQKSLDSARKNILEMLPQFVKDPQKVAIISEEFPQLSLHWLEKPPSEDYLKDDRGLLVLDEEKAAARQTVNDRNDIATVFSDPSLSFFTISNGAYFVKQRRGRTSAPELIELRPPVLLELEKDPESILGIMAHEAGHKIGPVISKTNGYDLNPQYQSLVACLKGSDSIALKNNQRDEAIADVISSEVLAGQLAEMKPDRRSEALIHAMGIFCSMDAYESLTGDLNTTDTHPLPALRIAGIFGANSNLRKVLGCEGSLPKFKSCDLGVTLSTKASAGRNSNKTMKGRQ